MIYIYLYGICDCEHSCFQVPEGIHIYSFRVSHFLVSVVKFRLYTEQAPPAY